MNLTNILQWLLYFYMYSLLGWVFESCYVSAKQHGWTNRGFLRGPMLPIYGSGAVMMLIVSEPFKGNYILVYFAGVIGATALEYVVGVVIEAIFKVRYWDYSYQKYNYKGYICLSSSIAWGFFTIGMNEWLHPGILHILFPISIPVKQSLTVVITLLFSVDIVMSVRDALELRDIILKLEEVREEMERLHRRMDVILAFMEADREDFLEEHPRLQRFAQHNEKIREELSHRMSEKKASMVERRIELKEKMEFLIEREENLFSKLSEKQRFELDDIKNNFHKIEQRRRNLHELNYEKHRKNILGNPSMRSEKHPDAFKTLYQYFVLK